MKRTILMISALILSVVLWAQTDNPLAMGAWKTHLSYNSVSQVVQSPSNIYAISDGALFSVGKDDGDLQVFSKISGLNDVNISKIVYDDLGQQLIVVYHNGNIDLLHTLSTYNVSDLFKKHMSADKTINEVFCYDKRAYISCNFGIVVLNLSRREIADTYIIGPNASEIKVVSTTIHGNTIYAITETKIGNELIINEVLQADITNPNLVNYQSWHATSGLPGSGIMQKIFNFQDKLILQRNNKLYVRDVSTNWTALLPDKNIIDTNVSSGKLIVGDGSARKYIFDGNLNLKEINMPITSSVEYDADNDLYWLAGQELGVISFQETGAEPNLRYFKPNGPAENIPWNLTFSGGRLFMVNGGRWASQDFRSGKVMIYDHGLWTAHVENQIKAITGQSALDFMNVAVNPNDPKHFFVTSFGTGLYEFRNDEFYKWHHHYNSALNSIFPGTGSEYLYIRLDGAVFDQNNNLYIANSNVNNLVKILTLDNEWKELHYPEIANLPTVGAILINKQNPNQKWMLSVRYTPGIFIWNDKGTVSESTDDQHIFISQFNDLDNPGATITPNYFYSIAQDKNGVVWVGTDIGPLLFYNTSKAFDAGYTCSRVKIPRNDGTDLADYLLQSEKVKAILVDGANRKWLGTENSGLYLMSENGQETIHHFTSANSPLLSDNIMSLAMDPETGELFVGTGNGLISFQTDAAEALSIFSNVYAYPNPVRESYNGIITITGLVAKTQVKITDLNGNLIYQTISNGKIATWDGKDYRGKKVNTGIYFAICVNEDGTQSTITKIMVIN